MHATGPTTPFRNRTALIVGGTSGIGLAVALALHDAGARVAIIGKESAPDDALGDTADDIPTDIYVVLQDITDRQNWQSAFDTCLSHFNGHLDIMVHTVGGSARSAGDGPLDRCTEEGWNAALRLNLDSAFFTLQSAVTQIIGQKPDAFGQRGMIALTGSVLANRPAISHFNTVGYAVAKAGLEGLVLNAAAAYAAQGIRVNMLRPGLVRTPMARRALGDDQISAFLEQKQPLTHGPISAAACAEALLGLINPNTVGLTGTILNLDGGWSLS